MNRKTTIPEQAPSDTPLRAKYFVRNRRTLIIVTDVTDNDLRQILDIVEKNEHPPHLLQ